MLGIEQTMLETALPTERVGLLLRLFGVPFDELPAGWFKPDDKGYELPNQLISEKARKATEGRLGMSVLADSFLQQLSCNPKNRPYDVKTNQNVWSKEVIENYPVAVESDDTFGKTELRKVRLNEDMGGNSGREAFLNSILPHWFGEDPEPSAHKVIVVLPLADDQKGLDGTWMHFKAKETVSDPFQFLQVLAASQLMGLTSPGREQLIDKSSLALRGRIFQYAEAGAIELNEELLAEVLNVGLRPERPVAMSYKFSPKLQFGTASLEKYQRSNPEYAEEDIGVTRDNLMQIVCRGSGVILSFDKVDVKRHENESSLLIMPKDLIYIINGTRRTTAPHAGESSRNGPVIKKQAASSFESNIDSAEVLDVIEIT